MAKAKQAATAATSSASREAAVPSRRPGAAAKGPAARPPAGPRRRPAEAAAAAPPGHPREPPERRAAADDGHWQSGGQAVQALQCCRRAATPSQGFVWPGSIPAAVRRHGL